MINVAYMVNTGEIGGGECSQLMIWKGFKKSPIKPIVFCPSNGPMINKIREMDISYFIQPYFQPNFKKPIKTMINTKNWKKYFKENNIELIHANDIFSARPVIKAAYCLKIPVLCHLRLSFPKPTYAWAFKYLPKPNAFIFCSTALKDDCGSILKQACPKTKQFILYNVVDTKKFCVETNQNNRQLRIGIIANLHPLKGHEDFLKMGSILIKKKYDLLFDIIGGSQDQSRIKMLKKTAEKLNIETKCLFHGYVKNVENIVKNLDIVVCASHVEAFGRCLIEAMACGKPVVATNVGGIPEVVVHKETGFIVPPQDPELLAKYVELLLNDKNMRISMGKKGRERVEENFALKNQTNSLINIYKKFISF